MLLLGLPRRADAARPEASRQGNPQTVTGEMEAKDAATGPERDQGRWLASLPAAPEALNPVSFLRNAP